MDTSTFKTFGDIFRYEAELFGHQERFKKLLTRRFGHIPLKLLKQVDNAEMADLDRWTDRLFDAKHIKEIFAEGRS